MFYCLERSPHRLPTRLIFNAYFEFERKPKMFQLSYCTHFFCYLPFYSLPPYSSHSLIRAATAFTVNLAWQSDPKVLDRATGTPSSSIRLISIMDHASGPYAKRVSTCWSTQSGGLYGIQSAWLSYTATQIRSPIPTRSSDFYAWMVCIACTLFTSCLLKSTVTHRGTG